MTRKQKILTIFRDYSFFMVLYHCQQCPPLGLKWLLTSSNHIHVPVNIKGKRQKKACLSLLGTLPETCTQHFCLYPIDHMGMHRKTHKKNWAMYLLKEVMCLATKKKKKKWDFIWILLHLPTLFPETAIFTTFNCISLSLHVLNPVIL